MRLLESELSVPTALVDIASRFHSLYRDRYGHATPTASIEAVNARLALLSTLAASDHGAIMGPGTCVGPNAPIEDKESRSTTVIFGAKAMETPIISRAAIGPDLCLGPALLVEDTSATRFPAVDRRKGPIFEPVTSKEVGV